MMTTEFQLRGDHVQLCDLLKLVGLADSGGQGKAMVAAGEVSVDGVPESRKTAKIRAGQIVACRGMQVKVVWGGLDVPPEVAADACSGG